MIEGDGRSLTCPACNSVRLAVVATRPHGGTTRRRRRCRACGHRFYTKEVYCVVTLEEGPIDLDWSLALRLRKERLDESSSRSIDAIPGA